MRQIDAIDQITRRCRMVNRAFGSALDPRAVAQLLPDEDIDLLFALDDHGMIDDLHSQLRMLVRLLTKG